MGSACRITVDGPDDLVERGRRLVHDLEIRWSRFRNDSEISWLNSQDGRLAQVSSITADLLRRAVWAREHTDGLFEPLLLDELVELGYDASHDTSGHVAVPAPLDEALAAFGAGTGIVRVPAGRRFDPGGLGKGFAADVVATHLLDAGADAVAVCLGGDVRLGGHVVADAALRVVDVLDPWESERVAATLHLGSHTAATRASAGAVATSTTLNRRWTDSDGCERHHLLDPRTRRPAETDLVAATVVAGEAWWAEAVAKAAVIGGTDVALDMLARHGLHGLLTCDDGTVLTAGATEAAA